MIKLIKAITPGNPNDPDGFFVEAEEIVRVNDLLELFERFVKCHVEEEGLTMMEWRGRFSEAEREFLLALAKSR